MKCIATFDVTSMALMFERRCRAAGYEGIRVVPVPRSISASCGLACNYPCDKHDEIMEFCEENGIELSGTHTL